jgi:fatty acid desaturase
MTDMHDEGATIGWYRTPIPRPVLKRLNARSDIKGFLRCCGILGLLACTGTATLWSAFSGHWIATPFLLFLHGTFGSFNINAVHELCHNTVFKTKWLNGLFVRIFGFIGWSDWVLFNTSHANHHRYTLHPPRDGEVVLPILWTTRKIFWKSAIMFPKAPYQNIKGAFHNARGAWTDEWTLKLFPPENPAARQQLMNWNRSVLIGHGLIFLGAVIGAVLSWNWAWLLVPYVVSFSATYGGWLFFLCNNTQHVGLTDKTPDFRMCCRTMKLPWIASFLYWNMEYHTEHHMYAAVPCYNLRKLQKEIAFDLPKPKGLVATWREIEMILKRQATEPEFQYEHPLPDTANPKVYGDSAHEKAAGEAPVDAGAVCDDLNPPQDVA